MVRLPVLDTDHVTLPAAATLAPHIRVKLDTAGAVVAAGATDKAIGCLTERGATSGAQCTVRLVGKPFTAIAHAAIAIGEILYYAAAGRVDVAGTVVAGVALSVATAQDDQVTVLRVE